MLLGSPFCGTSATLGGEQFPQQLRMAVLSRVGPDEAVIPESESAVASGP